MFDITIREEITQYIMLQRTTLDSENIFEEYKSEMINDYNEIKNFLPKECSSIVDIGCGAGGINIFLYRHFDKSVHIHLVDKTKIEDKIWYGYRERSAFYNSLELSESFLLDNHVNSSHLSISEADDDNSIKRDDSSVDLVTSFLSCGFHYPVSTYIDEIKRVLKDNGSLIIDIRKNKDLVEYLESHFDNVEIIKSGEKHLRVIAGKG